MFGCFWVQTYARAGMPPTKFKLDRKNAEATSIWEDIITCRKKIARMKAIMNNYQKKLIIAQSELEMLQVSSGIRTRQPIYTV